MSITPPPPRKRLENQEFKINLNYTVNLRLTWAIGNPVSKNQKNTQKNFQ